MMGPSSLAPVLFSLGAVGCWGSSDFIGGYASRRANPFLVTAIGHASGLIFVTALALANHAAFPEHRALWWSLGAGIAGGGGLALFYRALAAGRMGLAAPIPAVLGAAIPVIVAIFTEGLPRPWQIAGFILAAIGIWMITDRENKEHRAAGLGSAVLAGIGFAGFFLCIKQAGGGSPFWIAAASRSASLVLTGAIVLASRALWAIDVPRARLALLAGCLDVSGSVFFVRASQTGRLDEAVVLTSLYPVITVLLARFILQEHFTRWKTVGMILALLAVPMISNT